MKYLLLVLLLIGCNRKEKIVERQKVLTKEINRLKTEAYKHPIKHGTPQREVDTSTFVFMITQAVKLEREYDSLQVELKKY
jgi:hypothetical protein